MQNVIFEESIKGLSISHIIRNTDYTMPASHIHDNAYEIYYLLEGDRYYFIGTHTYHLSAGSLVFIRRDTIHKTASTGSAYHDRILLEVSQSVLHAVLSATKEFTEDYFFYKDCIILSLDEKEQEAIMELFLTIKRELISKQAGYRLMINSCLIRLFLMAQRQEKFSVPAISHLTDSPKYRKVEEVACYITEHFSAPLSLQTIARHFFMNKCYLSRIFKEVTGFTVMDYIHAYRIRQACILLRRGDMNVSQISETVGYESLTYFDRVFRKHVGLSPIKYKAEQELKT